MSKIKLPVRRAKNAPYPIAFRQEAIRLVHSGLSQQAVTARLHLGTHTLQGWVRQAKIAPTQPMYSPRLTPLQQAYLVRELRAGRLTEDEALRQYGVRHQRTVRRWVAAARAAEEAALPPPASVSPPGVLPETAELAQQLAQAQWQIEALHTLIEHAEATYHIAIRKKAGAKPST